MGSRGRRQARRLFRGSSSCAPAPRLAPHTQLVGDKRNVAPAGAGAQGNQHAGDVLIAQDVRPEHRLRLGAVHCHGHGGHVSRRLCLGQRFQLVYQGRAANTAERGLCNEFSSAYRTKRHTASLLQLLAGCGRTGFRGDGRAAGGDRNVAERRVARWSGGLWRAPALGA